MNFINRLNRDFRENRIKSTKKVNSLANSANSHRKSIYDKSMKTAGKHPIASFLVLLGSLLLLIILSNFLVKPKVTVEETALPTKNVVVYSIGESPKVTLQAQVEKSGVIKVVALGSGVVQSINAQVGQDVAQGTTLVSMSTNYQGGNAFSVQRQLAQVSYKNAVDTYDANKDIIAKQKEVAQKSNESADKLREINANSIDDTQNLINLNNDMLTSLSVAQEELKATNVDGSNDALIMQNQQMQNQLKSANAQLQSSVDTLQYTTSDTNAPAQIADITKDITIKQLELQEKALNLNKEVTRLNLQLAQITEALMYPSSPIAGTVERIYVKEGQAINPGTPIMQISGASDSLIAVVPMSKDMATGVSKNLVSTLHIGNKIFQSVPFYVSSDATDGSLFTAQYQIPQEYASLVTDKSYIVIEIPISYASTGSTVPFIPLDSVFQTQDASYVFIVKNGEAKSKRIILGQVIGSFVEVKKGLENGDQVILNRNVIDGDPVKVTNN